MKSLPSGRGFVAILVLAAIVGLLLFQSLGV